MSTTHDELGRDEHTEWAELEQVTPPRGLSANGAGGSVLDVVRARRAELVAESEHDVLVPGYRDLLAMRCKPLPASILKRARDVLERSPEGADFAFMADTLINACTEVLGRRSPTDPWESLESGDPVQIDDRLVELLALDVEGPQGRARDVLAALFSAAPSPELAIVKAGAAYINWAQGEDLEAEEDLLGES